MSFYVHVNPATMHSEDSGFFGSSLSRTRSILHTHAQQTRTSISRRSLQVFSHKDPPELRPNRRPSRASDQPDKMKSPLTGKRESRSIPKVKASKKGTVLRAVPVASATTPLSPLEQDMATLPNQEVLVNIGAVARTSPTTSSSDGRSSFRSSTSNSVHRSQTRSTSRTALSTIPAGTEMRFPELKGTIGIYKHGRIQWEQKDRSSIFGSSKHRRPRIQVVIPDHQRNRPLPTSPFFGQAPLAIGSVPAGSEYAHDVSPPSGSKKTLVRDSVVSPLSTQQHQHPVLNFRPLVVPQQSNESLNKDNVPSVSNSSDEYHEDDASSVYSKRSSMSSIEDSTMPKHPRFNFHERTASAAFSIKSPSQAGIFDSDPPPLPKSRNAAGEAGPKSHSPHRAPPPPRRYAPHPPIEEDTVFLPTCAYRPLRVSVQHQPTTTPNPSKRCSQRKTLSADTQMEVINQAIHRSSSGQFARNTPSPTLSEAENDLEQHLTSFTDDEPFKWDEMVPKPTNAANVISAPPAVPRKSSKRHSQMTGPDFRLSRVPCDHIVSQLKRNRSLGKGKGLKIDIPEMPKHSTDDFTLSPIPIPPKAFQRAITPEVAENVILTILRNLETLDDLFATAVLNRGFYRVFKRHELDLMKSALRKMSPPAWEHREICYPGHDEYDDEDLETPVKSREYTPTTYLQYYTRDMYIIAALKSLIKDKCQSFLRPEIACALLTSDSPESARVDDALWRIWTFCKIFGSGKGREDDIVAQMDWLKGGVLVHQKTCTFSILTTESIDMNGTLASAPECFAKGNEGGLTAEQLFDMMELWNCLGVLLQPFEGRTIQAREYGIYENTHIRGGDIDGEEMMLDEWYYYLLTLGLSPILDLAAPCRQSDASAFILASQNGWIDWKPPVFGGTRRNFLKEAASRVYEDKIAVTYAESSTKEVQRQLSKQRIQRHITELRQRKNSGERLNPPLRMSQERPISEWEDVINNLTRPRPPPSSTSNLVSHIPTLRSAASNSALAQELPELPESVPELPASRTPPPTNVRPPRSPPTRTVAQPLLPTPPPSTVPSVSGDRRSSVAPSMPSIDEHPAFRNRANSIPEMPTLEDHPAFRQHMRNQSVPSVTESNAPSNRSEDQPVFQQHQLQHSIFGSDAAENTADKAVYRIVEMGFTPEQARQALRMTDLGDGLRVDRAVELLLRGG